MDRLKDEKFAEFYKKYLFTIAQEEKNIKNEAKEGMNNSLKILAEILFALFPVVIYKDVDYLIHGSITIKEFFLLLFLFAFLFIFLFLSTSFILLKKDYQNAVKKYVFPEVLKIFGDIKRNEYVISSHIKKELIKSRLFSNLETVDVDDEFTGKYKEIEFILSEMILGTCINDEHRNIFKGIIIKFNLPKKYPDHILIFKDGMINKKINSFWAALFIFIIILALGIFVKIQTENWFCFELVMLMLGVPSFCLLFISLLSQTHKDDIYKEKIQLNLGDGEHFDLYSENKNEALCVARSFLLKKLSNLEKVFSANRIKCSFFDNSLIIAIEAFGDFFEIGDMFRKKFGPNTIYKVYRQINAVYELIDLLISYKKIYLT